MQRQFLSNDGLRRFDTYGPEFEEAKKSEEREARNSGEEIGVIFLNYCIFAPSETFFPGSSALVQLPRANISLTLTVCTGFQKGVNGAGQLLIFKDAFLGPSWADES